MRPFNIGSEDNVKNFLSRIFGYDYDENELLKKEMDVLHGDLNVYDKNEYEDYKGMTNLANKAYGLTGNINSGLAIINFYFSSHSGPDLKGFNEFKKYIINAYGYDYDLLWPTEEWIPYRPEKEGRSIDLVHNGISAVDTYEWWIRNSNSPAEDISRLGFNNAAKLVHFFNHVLCPQRFSISIDQLKTRILDVVKYDPDGVDTLLDLLIDPVIMESGESIDLNDLMDKAFSGLPFNFLIETMKTSDNEDTSIRDTVQSINEAFSISRGSVKLVQMKDSPAIFDLPLAVSYLDMDDCCPNILDIFGHHDSEDEEDQDNTDCMYSICKDIDLDVFRRIVRIFDFLKPLPKDMWCMLDTRDESGLHPGSFRVLMPTDPLWYEDDGKKLYLNESKETMIDNAEQIFGNGVDGAWRWMIWTRAQNDMADIMRIRKCCDDPIPDPPTELEHTIPSEVMEWVTDGVIPKSIAYKDEKRHKVKMNLTSASDKWFFWDPSGERWHLFPYDVLKAMPKTWSEALSCMKKNHDDSPVRIYDRALKDSIRFHNPNGKTTYSYEQYIQKQNDYQKEQEGFI